MTKIKKWPGWNRVWFKPRRDKSNKKSIEYVKKGEQSKMEWNKFGVKGKNYGKNALYWEFGKPSTTVSGDSSKKKLAVHDMLSRGMNDLEMMEENFSAYAHQMRAIDRYRMLKKPTPRIEKRKLILFWGEPGLGKTKAVLDRFGYDNVYEPPVQDSTNWFDEGLFLKPKVVLLDDYLQQNKLVTLLKIVDGWYTRKVPIKGTFGWLDCEIICITSNYHPNTWYQYITEKHDRTSSEIALRRRFDEIHHVQTNGVDIYDTAELIKSHWFIKGDDVIPSERLIPNSKLLGFRTLYNAKTNLWYCENMHVLDDNGYGFVPDCCMY